MSEDTKKIEKKLYVTDSGFLVNGDVKSDSYTACFRYLWATKQLPRHDGAGPEYAAIGLLNEYRATLKYGDQISREVRIAQEYGSEPSITLSGRIDGLAPSAEAPNCILEFKAMTSESGSRAVIKNGIPKVKHVGQIASYELLKSLNTGYLMYSYWAIPPSQLGFQVYGERNFKVEIGSGGRIIVDGTSYQYTAKNLEDWYNKAATEVFRQGIPEVTHLIHNTWGHLCNSCPFFNICKVGENSTDKFLEQAGIALKAQKPYPFKITIKKK